MRALRTIRVLARMGGDRSSSRRSDSAHLGRISPTTEGRYAGDRERRGAVLSRVWVALATASIVQLKTP
jgi:hypothetical protein